jgi:mono/diheme cytochrome c family protein
MLSPFRRSALRSRAALFFGAFLAGGAAAIGLGADGGPSAARRAVDFAKEVQPLLAEHCYSCHGPEKQKGDLRWDDKGSVFKPGEHGPIIQPGKGAESRVIILVAGLDPDTVMPPKGERLSEAQIELLRAWIDQGASWPDSAVAPGAGKTNHWGFKAPLRPAVPSVRHKEWVRNPIDSFILARLESEQLEPSPEAGRVPLIRRLNLDLTGLPPTPKEVDDFVADENATAYERLVERLLGSAHFGERWARQWLDVARYADSNGYEKDRARSIWPYRDWVIKALNADLPYDQFTVEQLAGDLLPNATPDQVVATGFLRNSMLNQEGGIEPEQFRAETLVDRVDALGKAFLGLTLNCCQCHNHKYDPFTQKEYYQLYAFLNNDDEAFAEVPTAEQTQKRQGIRTAVRALEDQAMREATNLVERMASWEKELAAPTTNWAVLEPLDWESFATKYEKQEDNSLLGGGDIQPGDGLRITAETQATNITGFRLEALVNQNLVYGGPGLLGRGSFFLREFTVEAASLRDPAATNRIKFRRATADREAAGFGITNAIDGNTEKGGWTPATLPDHRNENHHAVFECAEPFGFPGGTRLVIRLHQQFKPGDNGLDSDSGLECHMFGCVRLSLTTNAVPLWVDPLTPAQRQVLAIPGAQRTPDQMRDLFGAFRLTGIEYTNLNRQIADAWTNWPYPPTTMVLHQRARPRETHVFKRGDRLRPGEEVRPDVPAALHALPADAPRNRLGLARWIADRRSPTTARVLVNRLWQEYFGVGLVASPEDFGTRVETPSHPELLDWLACEFMDSGWSLKHMHRLIVNSATYRQSSLIPPSVLARDPYNRLLARAPRLRVEGEVLQDIVLFASGLLNPKIGGPSVYPPIPGSVGDAVYGGFSWPETKGEDRYRRGLYTFWKRSLPFPALAAFDAPSRETACPRRGRSNTPLQSLTTLNEKTFIEAAQALALRALKEGGPDDAGRLAFAFRLCTGRRPTKIEADRLLGFWKEQYGYFEDRTGAAVAVASPDPKQMPQDVNLHKVAAWTMISRVILNLDETITKE